MGYTVCDIGSPVDGILTKTQARLPYTPETSPPTPYLSSDTIKTTRSGATMPKRVTSAKPLAVKGSRVEKRNKNQKARTTPSVIQKPLTEISRDVPHIPVADIATLVARSVEQRLDETSRNKRVGQIKRPMNAFMLYRKAYQEVAKSQCAQNNHQHVSKVCGAGWLLEPPHIRDMFNEWARLERENHQSAHPGYKFTPSKPRKGKNDSDADSTVCSDADDSDWTGGRRKGAVSARLVRHVSRLSEVPSIAYERYAVVEAPSMASGMQHQSLYHHQSPESSFALPYGHAEAHSYEGPLHQRHMDMGIAGDAYSRTPSPGVGYPSHLMASSAELAEAYHREHFEDIVDPSLATDGSYGLYNSLQRHVSVEPREAWHSHLDAAQWHETTFPSLDEEHAHDYLKGGPDDWKVEEVEEASHFENWMAQTEEGRF